MIRKASVAGQFYPDDKNELKEEVGEYLDERKQNIKMAISPHAGYMFSGKLAGDVLGKFENKKDFVILGVNHSGIGEKICFSSLDFETPLGVVKNNVALGNKILKKLRGEINEASHEKEHSIEVQLPFLQQSQKKFSIVPILLKDLNYEACVHFAEVLAEFVDENIGLIISSDFTHYGLAYNFLPFKENIRKNLYYLDNEVIINILNLNSKKVYELAEKTTICGLYGITIITEIAKLKKMKAKLIGYYTSGDVVDNWENCVGYAGLVFS